MEMTDEQTRDQRPRTETLSGMQSSYDMGYTSLDGDLDSLLAL
jgi:hypothetical protein